MTPAVGSGVRGTKKKLSKRLRPGLFIVGTRPEAIKMLPVILAFKQSGHYDVRVVSTGQHEEMTRRVLAIGGIEPDVTFSPNPRPGELNSLFGHVMEQLDEYVRREFIGREDRELPVCCFVHGDTSSAAAAALSAFHMRIPVVHVEAGLRTSNILSPFPEELNRQLISRIAALHLAPTMWSRNNLSSEGVPGERVFITGNTSIDMLQIAADHEANFSDGRLCDLVKADSNRKFVVVTAHRRENWGEPIERIATTVRTLAEQHADFDFVVALHPNPTVAKPLTKHLDGLPNVILTPPLDYVEFATLLKLSEFAISDSGGIQEEAPALATPVLVLRDSTERQEGVRAGTVSLVGTDPERILSAANLLLTNEAELLRRQKLANPYGDGRAAERILQLADHIVYDDVEPAPFGSGVHRMSVLNTAGYFADPSPRLWTRGPEA
ncbi:MAG: non-hydrolyzing UDP-N-acetylglucosamine 2-epimerase [Canibacter sp.]